MTEHHWTDAAPSPVFTTVIRAAGPAGNVFAVLGTACAYLRQLDIPRDRIEKLRTDVKASGSYDAALALVGRWFPVERE